MLLAPPGPPVTELVPCVHGTTRAGRPCIVLRAVVASVDCSPRRVPARARAVASAEVARWLTARSTGSSRARATCIARVGALRALARPSGPGARGRAAFRRVRRRLRDLLPGRRALRRGVHRARRGLHRRPVLHALGGGHARPRARPRPGRHASATACLIGKGSGIVGARRRSRSATTCSPATTCTSPTPTTATKTSTLPIGKQFARAAPGARSATARGSGTARSCCPGADIGRHVVVGAGSVVTGALPDFCVAVGNPARVIRRYVEGEGWVRVEPRDARAGDQPTARRRRVARAARPPAGACVSTVVDVASS